MRKVILLLLLLALIIVPATATLVNCSVIIGNTPGTTYHQTSPTNAVPTFSFTTTSGYVIASQQYTLTWTEGSQTTFSLKRLDGTTINGTFNLQNDGVGGTYGTQTATINGGTTLTSIYGRVPGLNAIYPPQITGVFLKSNVSSDYYFVMSTQITHLISSLEFHVGAPFDLDTTRDAYITLSTTPSQNPIIGATISNSQGKTFLVYINYVSESDFRYSETNSNNPVATKSDLDRLLGEVSAVLAKIGEFAVNSVSFLSLAMYLAILVYTPIIFLTMIAAYTIFALVMSFYDSDDLIKSISKFIRYELKLFRFFMEIFNSIKKIIIWWA
jgi:hypothetical protein